MEKRTFTTKLFEVCSTDELRPIMMCVHFKNGFAYATDGKIVIKQALTYHSIVNPECLEGKSLHRANYKAIMAFEKAECDDSGIKCEDNDGRVAFFEYFDRKGDEMPDFDSVLKPSGMKSIEFIGINPDHLARLAKAIHSLDGHIKMEFQGVDRIILIEVNGMPDQYAGIMPVLLNDTLF